jgi:hypothetical protein
LLEQIDNPVNALSADGAYDVMGVYLQREGHGREYRIPVQIDHGPTNEKSDNEESTNGDIACL